jgi:hypothetical protein
MIDTPPPKTAPAYTNPQTEAFSRLLGIDNKINPGRRTDSSSPVASASSSGDVQVQFLAEDDT